VIIKSNLKNNVILVPGWTVLGNKYIWIIKDNQPILKPVKAGKSHGANIEILEGLSNSDKIITDPKLIISNKYQIL